MSDRILQPSPQAGTRQATMRYGLQSPWSATKAAFPDIHFLRTWLEYDSKVDVARPRKGMNWYPLLGLLLVLGVSAGFWAGVGLVVARLFK